MKRRRLLFMMTSAILILAFSLAGCRSTPKGNEMTQETNQKETTSGPASSKVEETAAPSAFKQSPYLDDKGLPPVQGRLPKEPKLTNELPKDALNYEIGIYGGKLRTVRTDPISDSDIFTIENEPLVNSPGLMGEEITPNVLKAYKVSDDQKEFTFTLREGMRWSDGESVTVDDVRFAVEDVLFNKELTTTFPLWLKSTADADSKPLTFTVLDNNTFKISFDHPYGGFLMQLAVQGWRGYTDFLKPKHFLQKYHVKYTPLEKLEPLIKEAGFGPGEWTKLFTSKDVLNIESTQPKAVGFPVLSPYLQVKAGTVIEFERNPYYFKIDAKGNQLPYIDKLESTMVQNVETAVLKVMGGEVDHSYEYVTIPKVAMLKENEKKGHYKVYINKLHRTANDIHLNFTYEDPVWRQVVRDVRFRKALNLALNKKEFVNSIFLGFAKPSSIEGTNRNLEEAGRLLDEMGMVKGPDGFRLGPDGKKFIIPFEVSSYYDDFIQLGELVVEQWKEVGLQVTLKKIENSLWNSRVQSNQLQATIMFTPGPVQWARQEWGQNLWAPLWDKWWNTSGKQGEEPPAEAKALFNAIFKLRELPLQEALKKREDIRKNIGENYWYYIHSEDIVAPVAVNEKIGNFTDKGWGIAQNFSGEQWFFRN